MRQVLLALAAAASIGAASPDAPERTPPAGLEAALSYPFATSLTRADRADRIAWITVVKGVRTVWTATAPAFRPVALTRDGVDDGQELTGLVLSPDGGRAVWVRGGDHDANWAAEGDLQPNPAADPTQAKLTVWTAGTRGGPAVALGEGDSPAISADGRIAFVRGGKVWVGDADGRPAPEQIFFDRGSAESLAWSPDGRRLAFVSRRGDHSFVGVFTAKDQPLRWLAPSTGFDERPVWSPDGTRLAFTRRPGDGGAPEPMLTEQPAPWSIVVADAATGEGAPVWRSPHDANGSYPAVADGANLLWGAGDRLVFRAELDGWPHLYSLAASGGAPLLLTPGPFMAEHLSISPDGRWVAYDANSGPYPADDDRRHVFRVAVDRPGPIAVTRGRDLQYTPAAMAGGQVAYVSATATAPSEVRVADAAGDRTVSGMPTAYTGDTAPPRRVLFRAADGQVIHGQIFAARRGTGKRPAVVFLHGGPPRQMLLGPSYMDYYAHAYALNQYLAARGFTVLSVNYRLGIGYGRAFQHPAKAGPAGASEYQDVQAAARYLAGLPTVDAGRIGLWGGSYGGYLTALALARDSAMFRAGVDLHGVHDWSRLLSEEAQPVRRYEQGDWADALRVAFRSSPVADVAGWRSPVLLIHGDDDRNVRFNQTIDLVRRLDAQGVPYEELVLPNEIHGFLRYADWVSADTATVRFLEAQLRP